MFAYIKNGTVVRVTSELLPETLIGVISGERVELPNQDIDGCSIIEFEGNYIEPTLIGNNIQESPSVKHSNKYNEIVSTKDIQSITIDEEVFSDVEIGDIITARVFGGNSYAQAVLQAKFMKAMMKQISGTADETDLSIIAKADYVNQKINEIRRLFGLSDM